MKRFFAALVASMSVLSPAVAEVQPGTYDLIQTVKAHMTVEIDTPFCDKQEKAAGAFDPNNQRIILCPRGDVDADDHDTVRHEVWHVIQHCITPKTSKYLNTVIAVGSSDWNQHILGTLSYSRVQWIKESYPEVHHNAELEAFAVAQNMTATQISNLFTKFCLN